MVVNGITKQRFVSETFGSVKTIPDYLMWDPRLMCLKECFYFILEEWALRVGCVNAFYFVFVQGFIFCK